MWRITKNIFLVTVFYCIESVPRDANHYLRLMDKQHDGVGPIPLGWAPEGKQLLLLTKAVKRLRCETGEIALKSRFLAQGYWNNQTLAKKDFVPIRVAATSDLSIR
jgi:hypothetical protein